MSNKSLCIAPLTPDPDLNLEDNIHAFVYDYLEYFGIQAEFVGLLESHNPEHYKHHVLFTIDPIDMEMLFDDEGVFTENNYKYIQAYYWCCIDDEVKNDFFSPEMIERAENIFLSLEMDAESNVLYLDDYR